MPTEATSKPRRQTWREWQSPDMPEPARLYTRDQTLGRIKRLGIKAKLSDIRYWESLGVLPGPVRQWHEGAVRGLYPGWYIALVYFLRRLQSLKIDLDHAGRILDDKKRHLPGMLSLAPAQYNLETDQGLREMCVALDTIVSNYAAGNEWAPSQTLVRDLGRLTRYQEQLGTPVERVEVRVIPADGRNPLIAYEFRPSKDEQRSNDN